MYLIKQSRSAYVADIIVFIREHLRRRHFKETGCHRCGLYLESNQALQDHLRSLDICPVKVILPQMGFMTQIQSEEIGKKRQVHTVPLLQRWKEIYLILFPDADEDTIPGPCEYTTPQHC